MNISRAKSLLQRLRRMGPYLLIELILPGGTLIALLLWFADQAKGRFPQPAARASQSLVSAAAITVRSQLCPRLQPAVAKASFAEGAVQFQECSCRPIAAAA